MNEQKQSKRWIGYLLMAVMAAAFLYRGVYQVATGRSGSVGCSDRILNHADSGYHR